MKLTSDCYVWAHYSRPTICNSIASSSSLSRIHISQCVDAFIGDICYTHDSGHVYMVPILVDVVLFDGHLFLSRW